MNDSRPEWPHKNMSESDFRRIVKIGPISAVESKWEYTSADTSRDWLEATDRNKKKHVLPAGWKCALKFEGWSSNPGLFDYTYEGREMLKTLEKIDAWEKNKPQWIKDKVAAERQHEIELGIRDEDGLFNLPDEETEEEDDDDDDLNDSDR